MSKNTQTFYWLLVAILVLMGGFGAAWMVTDAIKPAGGDIFAVSGIGVVVLFLWAMIGTEISGVRRK